MSRAFERKIIYAAGAWQIFTGLITVFIYSLYIKKQGAGLENLDIVQQRGIQSYFDSLFSFAVTYGIFFVLIGVLNIIFANKLLKDDTLQVKVPIYLICLACIFYFLTDFISLMLCLAAAVIALAKNKPVKVLLADIKQ
jgi:hypothetical protein